MFNFRLSLGVLDKIDDHRIINARMPTNNFKYLSLIGLIFLFFCAELGTSIWANSLTLQTDAFHMLSDLIALIIGYTSSRLMDREKCHSFTYGWLRAEIIGGLINSVFLLSICFTLVLEICHKLSELVLEGSNPKLEQEIDWVLIVAALGLAVNLFGLIMFCYDPGNSHHGHSHGHSHEDSHQETKIPYDEIDEELDEDTTNYNHYAVMLHILGDTLGSVVVIMSGLVIKYAEGNWKFYLDPLGSFLIVIVISISSYKLLKRCISILLHKTPHSTDSQHQILEKIQGLEQVEEVHHFHIWPLNNQITIASLHVRIKLETEPDNRNSSNTGQIITQIKEILHGHGVHSSTIQPEWSETCSEPVCSTKSCSTKKCCPTEGESAPTP